MARAAVRAVGAEWAIGLLKLRAGAAVVAIAIGGPVANLRANSEGRPWWRRCPRWLPLAHAAVDAVSAVSTIRVLGAGAAVVAVAVGGPVAVLYAHSAGRPWWTWRRPWRTWWRRCPRWLPLAHAAVEAISAVSTIRVLGAGAAVVAVAVGGPVANLYAHRAGQPWWTWRRPWRTWWRRCPRWGERRQV